MTHPTINTSLAGLTSNCGAGQMEVVYYRGCTVYCKLIKKGGWTMPPVAVP